MLFYFACEAAGASVPGIPHALLGRKLTCITRTHSRRENADTRDPHSVIAREGGRSSIAEELMINRGAAAYWIPAFAGMTIGGACDELGLVARGGRRRPPAGHRPRTGRARRCRAVSAPAEGGDPGFPERWW